MYCVHVVINVIYHLQGNRDGYKKHLNTKLSVCGEQKFIQNLFYPKSVLQTNLKGYYVGFCGFFANCKGDQRVDNVGKQCDLNSKLT